MESGSAGTLQSFEPSRGDLLWDTFVANVTVCAGVPRGLTFTCLRNATTAALLSSWEAAVDVIPDLFPFVPVVDGPGGLLPDIPANLLTEGNFSRIPFIAGTVLDEGTDFVPRQLASQLQFQLFLIVAVDPFPEVVTSQFQLAGGTLLAGYPDDPALGSPFGTGNETFGLSSQYKRTSAMFGDLAFQAMRRRWIQTATAAGVVGYGYIFTDQHVAAADPAGGGSSASYIGSHSLPLLTSCLFFAVYHSSEVPYVYGSPSIVEANEESGRVSLAMVDYWVSFAVSGTPNDGKGLASTSRSPASSLNVLTQARNGRN